MLSFEACPSKPARKFFTDVSVDPFVRGLLHRPANPNGDGLVLTHGAGSNCQAPLLIALAETFAEAGFIVLRCDLPYRQDRPYGPPGPGDGKRDRAGLKNAIAVLKNPASGRIFLGGHSYGGRQASMLCAETAEKSPEEAAKLAAGLLLLSYPLHPPRKARAAPHAAFFPSAHARAVCPGHARSLRRDRRNRGSFEADTGEDEAADD